MIALAGREGACQHRRTTIVDVLLPGHGDPVLTDVGAGITRSAESFRRLVPPPNVLS